MSAVKNSSPLEGQKGVRSDAVSEADLLRKKGSGEKITPEDVLR